MSALIKVGFCVAYDWEFLKNSLHRVYDNSDIICLALDKDRHSWSNNPFSFEDEKFYTFVKKIDTDNKIDVYEDDFSLSDLNARENCNRHRTLIAERMGADDGWHIQIDVDEYFTDFKGFCEYLLKIRSRPNKNQTPVNVNVMMFDLIKKLEDGYLFVDYIDKRPSALPFATTCPKYERARNNGHFSITSPYYVIHETWVRSEHELRFKLANWGHSTEELKEKKRQESFVKLWNSLDQHNYKYVKNFHFAIPNGWPSIGYLDGKSIDEFISNFRIKTPYSNFDLFIKNNRNIARLKSLFQSIRHMKKINN